jgi:hypothetical protein
MSDNKRTITINPELFKIPTANKSRKKSDPTDSKIKVKSTAPKKRDNTLKKKSILKMIRQHQEDKYKKLFGEKHKDTTNEIQKEIDSISQIESDFEESKKFLMKLTEENEEKEKQQRLNSTIKRYPHDNNTEKMSLLYENAIPTFETFEDVSSKFPEEPTQTSPTVTIQPRITSAIQPNYGCLKNGSLPTYKHFLNKTVKNTPPILPGMNSMISIRPSVQPNLLNTMENAIVETKINNIQENIKKMSEMKQMMSKLEAIKNNKIKKCMRQKRIVRRTYKIGKSKVLPRISVLVSNKTLRNNTTTKCQLLKQDSIADIKKYLIKRGLIKVGTSAPNDVLRKMYESCVMICGEVQNHNPENLLHNFLNGKEEM